MTISLELHSHTRASEDCLTQPRNIILLARKKKLRIAITDHNTIRGALEAHALAPDWIIVGEEIMTTQGELLAYFVKEEVPPGLTPAETIARLRVQGAAISVSHPFDRLRKGAWREPDLLAIAPWVDAIEVFNARCVYAEDNVRAEAFARQHNLAGTVGSDAHSLREFGRARLMVERADTAPELIEGFRQGARVTRLSSPAIHLTSRFAKTWKMFTHPK